MIKTCKQCNIELNKNNKIEDTNICECCHKQIVHDYYYKNHSINKYFQYIRCIRLYWKEYEEILLKDGYLGNTNCVNNCNIKRWYSFLVKEFSLHFEKQYIKQLKGKSFVIYKLITSIEELKKDLFSINTTEKLTISGYLEQSIIANLITETYNKTNKSNFEIAKDLDIPLSLVLTCLPEYIEDKKLKDNKNIIYVKDLIFKLKKRKLFYNGVEYRQTVESEKLYCSIEGQFIRLHTHTAYFLKPILLQNRQYQKMPVIHTNHTYFSVYQVILRAWKLKTKKTQALYNKLRDPNFLI